MGAGPNLAGLGGRRIFDGFVDGYSRAACVRTRLPRDAANCLPFAFECRCV